MRVHSSKGPDDGDSKGSVLGFFHGWDSKLGEEVGFELFLLAGVSVLLLPFLKTGSDILFEADCNLKDTELLVKPTNFSLV